MEPDEHLSNIAHFYLANHGTEEYALDQTNQGFEHAAFEAMPGETREITMGNKPLRKWKSEPSMRVKEQEGRLIAAAVNGPSIQAANFDRRVKQGVFFILKFIAQNEAADLIKIHNSGFSRGGVIARENAARLKKIQTQLASGDADVLLPYLQLAQCDNNNPTKLTDDEVESIKRVLLADKVRFIQYRVDATAGMGQKSDTKHRVDTDNIEASYDLFSEHERRKSFTEQGITRRKTQDHTRTYAYALTAPGTHGSSHQQTTFKEATGLERREGKRHMIVHKTADTVPAEISTALFVRLFNLHGLRIQTEQLKIKGAEMPITEVRVRGGSEKRLEKKQVPLTEVPYEHWDANALLAKFQILKTPEVLKQYDDHSQFLANTGVAIGVPGLDRKISTRKRGYLAFKKTMHPYSEFFVNEFERALLQEAYPEVYDQVFIKQGTLPPDSRLRQALPEYAKQLESYITSRTSAYIDHPNEEAIKRHTSDLLSANRPPKPEVRVLYEKVQESFTYYKRKNHDKGDPKMIEYATQAHDIYYDTTLDDAAVTQQLHTLLSEAVETYGVAKFIHAESISPRQLVEGIAH